MGKLWRRSNNYQHQHDYHYHYHGQLPKLILLLIVALALISNANANSAALFDNANVDASAVVDVEPTSAVDNVVEEDESMSMEEQSELAIVSNENASPPPIIIEQLKQQDESISIEGGGINDGVTTAPESETNIIADSAIDIDKYVNATSAIAAAISTSSNVSAETEAPPTTPMTLVPTQSIQPSSSPSTASTSESPTIISSSPTPSPSLNIQPSNQPSSQPSNTPSTSPTIHQTSSPSNSPSLSHQPTTFPSLLPTTSPSTTTSPSITPTTTNPPSYHPSDMPTISPIIAPSTAPSLTFSTTTSRQYIQQLTVSIPQSFSLDQIAVYQFLYQQYTTQFGYEVGNNAIETKCLVLSQQIGINSIRGSKRSGDNEKLWDRYRGRRRLNRDLGDLSRSHEQLLINNDNDIDSMKIQQPVEISSNNDNDNINNNDGSSSRRLQQTDETSTSTNSNTSPSISSSSNNNNNNPSTPSISEYPLTMRFTMTYSTRIGVYDISNYNQLFTDYVNTHLLPKIVDDMQRLELPVISVDSVYMLKDKSPTMKPTEIPVRLPTLGPVTTNPTKDPTVSPTTDFPTSMPSLVPSILINVEDNNTPGMIGDVVTDNNSFVLGLSLGLVGAFMISALGLVYYRHVEKQKSVVAAGGGIGNSSMNMNNGNGSHHQQGGVGGQGGQGPYYENHGYSNHHQSPGSNHQYPMMNRTNHLLHPGLPVVFGGMGNNGGSADDMMNGAASKSTIDLTPNNEDDDDDEDDVDHAENSNSALENNGLSFDNGGFHPLKRSPRRNPQQQQSSSPQDNNDVNADDLEGNSPGGQSQHSQQLMSHQQIDMENGQGIYLPSSSSQQQQPILNNAHGESNIMNNTNKPILQPFNGEIMDSIFAPPAQQSISPDATSVGYSNLFSLPYQDSLSPMPSSSSIMEVQHNNQQQQQQQLPQSSMHGLQHLRPGQLLIHNASFSSDSAGGLIDDNDDDDVNDHHHDNDDPLFYDPSYLDGSQDELDNYKNQDLETLRTAIEDAIDGVEGMMSLAMARALTEPEDTSLDSLPWATELVSQENSSSSIEASCLCETYDWLKRLYDPEKGLDSINEYFQEILNKIVISVMFGMTSPIQGATTVHACATILGLDLLQQLPQTTLVITGMRKTNDLSQGHNFIVKAFKIFGKIEEAAIAPNNRGFGFVRFAKPSSVERAMRKYREYEIEIQDVSVSIKTLKSEQPH